MNLEIDAFGTIFIAVIVLFVGQRLVNRIAFLKRYNLPEPVAGGLVAACVTLLLFQFFDVRLSFNADIQTAFMLMFFTSVGLSASVAKLKEGGKTL